MKIPNGQIKFIPFKEDGELRLAIETRDFDKSIDYDFNSNSQYVDLNLIQRFYNDMINCLKRHYFIENNTLQLSSFSNITSIIYEHLFTEEQIAFNYKSYFKILKTIIGSNLLSLIEQYVNKVKMDISKVLKDKAEEINKYEDFLYKYKNFCSKLIDKGSHYYILGFSNEDLDISKISNYNLFIDFYFDYLKNKDINFIKDIIKNSTFYKNIQFLLSKKDQKPKNLIEESIITVAKDISKFYNLDLNTNNKEELLENFKKNYLKIANIDDYYLYTNDEFYENMVKLKSGQLVPKEEQEEIFIKYANLYIDEIESILKENFFIKSQKYYFYVLALNLFNKNVDFNFFIKIKDQKDLHLKFSYKEYLKLINDFIKKYYAKNKIDDMTPLDFFNYIFIPHLSGKPSLYFIVYSYNIYLFFYLFYKIYVEPFTKKEFLDHFMFIFKKEYLVTNAEIDTKSYYENLIYFIFGIMSTITPNIQKPEIFDLNGLKLLLSNILKEDISEFYKNEIPISIIDKLFIDEGEKLLLSYKVKSHLSEIFKEKTKIIFPSYYEQLFNFKIKKTYDELQFGYLYKDNFYVLTKYNGEKTYIPESSLLGIERRRNILSYNTNLRNIDTFVVLLPKNYGAYYHNDFMFKFSDPLIFFDSNQVFVDFGSFGVETAATLYYSYDLFKKEVQEIAKNELDYFIKYGNPKTGSLPILRKDRNEYKYIYPLNYYNLYKSLPRSSIILNLNYAFEMYKENHNSKISNLFNIIYGFIEHEYKHNYYYFQHFYFERFFRKCGLKGDVLFSDGVFYVNNEICNISGDVQLNQEVLIFLSEHNMFPFCKVYRFPPFKSFIEYILYMYIYQLYSIPYPSKSSGEAGDGEGGGEGDSENNKGSGENKGDSENTGKSKGKKGEDEQSVKPIDSNNSQGGRVELPHRPERREKFDDPSDPAKYEREALKSKLNFVWRIFKFFDEIETLIRNETSGVVPHKDIAGTELQFSPSDFTSERSMDKAEHRSWSDIIGDPATSEILSKKHRIPADIPYHKTYYKSIEAICLIDVSGSMTATSSTTGVSYYDLALSTVNKLLELGLHKAYIVEFTTEVISVYTAKSKQILPPSDYTGATNFYEAFNQSFDLNNKNIYQKFPSLREAHEDMKKGYVKLVLVFGDYGDSLSILKYGEHPKDFIDTLNNLVKNKIYTYFCPVDIDQLGSEIFSVEESILNLEKDLTNTFLNSLKLKTNLIKVLFPFSLLKK